MSHRRLLFTRIYRKQMEKSNILKCHNQLWFVISVSFIFWCFVFYFHYSALLSSSKNEVRVRPLPINFAYSVVSPESYLLNVTENKIKPVNRLAETAPLKGGPDKENRNKSIISLPLEDNRVELINEIAIEKSEAEPVKDETKAVNSVQAKEDEAKPVDQVAISENQTKIDHQQPVVENKIEPVTQLSTKKNEVELGSDWCSGRYIYVHNLPSKFNDDLLKNCRSLSLWTNMCQFISNAGLGPPLANFERVFSNTSWFATNQFALEVIFHNRMKQYKCLTNDSSIASAIYVPFYAGFDVARYLWGFNTSMRDSDSLDLVNWLTARPEWKVLWGKDHFLVAGRITWDFRRLGDDDFDWGNNLMVLPEVKNMSMLVIESSPWHSNDFAIPYPTYFHPSEDIEVFEWQNRMGGLRRRYLFCFAGGQRPNLADSIRGQIIDQCRASRRKCKLLECDSGASKCHNPSIVMKMFQSSIFCLQPAGDSFTRRSAFDSILAGCIPVFFHPGSAYIQYTWHLPQNYTKYSVLIPEKDVREGKVSIEKRLLKISTEEVRAMRVEVIKLIPRLIYSDPRGRLETLEDAFDIAIQGVLKKVDRERRAIRDGGNSAVGYAEKDSWKYNLLGTVEEHEWDPLFSETKDEIS